MPSLSRFAAPFAGPLLTLVMLASSGHSHAAQVAQTREQQAEAQKQLADIRAKLETLASQQAATAARRDSVNAELAHQAAALSSAARAVRETDLEIAAKQGDLEQLQHQRTALQQRLDLQRAAIADLLRATYTLGRGSDLRLLLGDEDVARIARALVYSKYFQQDRLRRVQQLMADLAKLQDLQTAISAQEQALLETRKMRQQQVATLIEQRASQQKLAAAADSQFKDQAQRVAALKQNEQSLNYLLDKLQRAIEQAARNKPVPARPSATANLPGASANIRGNLPWPAAGMVTTYGNGVLIKAAGGNEVHAVARGRVIYAGFLRGYGLLLIVDHGHGWMSMYGNNESLLHGVGDEVESGEAIGTASAVTGVNTGVYFELRKAGQPVDPRSWLSQRR